VYEFAADGTALRRLEVCDFPRHLVLSRDGATLHVTCSGISSMVSYRLTDGTRVEVAATGRNPRSMARTGDGRFLAVANYDGRSVTWIDRDRRERSTLEPRDSGRIVGVAVHSAGGVPRIYATSWDTRELIAFGP